MMNHKTVVSVAAVFHVERVRLVVHQPDARMHECRPGMRQYELTEALGSEPWHDTKLGESFGGQQGAAEIDSSRDTESLTNEKSHAGYNW
jgi:hypothetical protein